MQKILLYFFSFIALSACVEKRDLSNNTVLVHISTTPDGLHPLNDNSSIRSFVFQYTQKALFKTDLRDLSTLPLLIENLPDTIRDAYTYYFDLRKDVKWDNGQSLTAEDIVFTSKMLVCPLTNNAQIRGIYSSVLDSVWYDQENPFRVFYRCKILHRDCKSVFSEVYIQQKAFWDPKGITDELTFQNLSNHEPSEPLRNWFDNFNAGEQSFQPDKLVGLGAYQIVEFVSGSHISLEKKKGHWSENDTLIYHQAKPDKIIFKVISDDAAVALALKSEKIDVTTSIGTNKLLKLQQKDYFNENYYSAFTDRFVYNYLGLNMKPDGITQKPFFVDQRVRRAMAHLVPVDEIIEVILKGKGMRQTTNVSPLSPLYNPNCKPIELNIERAKALLTEAGWVDTDGDNIRDKKINGVSVPFVFNLSYMSGGSAGKDVVLMIVDEMYKAGIVAKPTPMDFSIFYKNAMNHEFDAMLGGWGSGATYSDPMQLWSTESWANKGSNFCGFGDASTDALILKCNTTLDDSLFLKYYHDLQMKIYEEQPYVFLFSSSQKVAIHKRFKNIKAYVERPGVIVNAFELDPTFTNIKTTVE